MYNEGELNNMLLRLTEATEFLAADFTSQCKKSQLPNDMIPDDIANDWDWVTKMSKSLAENKIISAEAYSIITLINSEFEKVSFGQPNYEEVIWTAEGLKNHPFWEEQRMRSRELQELLQESHGEDL